MSEDERAPRTVLERSAVIAADTGNAAELDRVGAELDALDDAERARLSAPDALGRAALWYALRGVAVFPLQPGGKRPHVGSHGFHEATTDPDQVRAWWARAPLSNIGAPTGLRFDVWDVDGAAGASSWVALVARGILDEYPAIGRAFTPRGQHVFTHPTGDGNTAGIVPGVDYRGAGGYVVLPPSRREDGRRYRWATVLDVELWAGQA